MVGEAGVPELNENKDLGRYEGEKCPLNRNGYFEPALTFDRQGPPATCSHDRMTKLNLVTGIAALYRFWGRR